MKSKWLKLIWAVFLSAATGSACSQQEADSFRGLKINQLQLIGSHNSYKPGIEPLLWNIIYKLDSAKAISLQYGHIGFTDQLNMGLRNLEIDVVHDPEGGRYTNPLGLQMVKGAGGTPMPYDTGNTLSKPGLKVFHVQDLDFRSHHLLFTDCLKELKSWSQIHPGHLPVIVTINAKDDDIKGLHKMLPFTLPALDSIDLEIRRVFKPHELITPDFIRGHSTSLEAAVLGKGWPKLEKIKGRFLFVLDEKGKKLNDYKKDHPGLANRVMFVIETEGSPEAAFMIINDPVKEEANIQRLVKKGYLIRTRADGNTTQARNNDYRTFEAAKRSNAQIITTDYYLPSTYFASPYKVVFEDGKYFRKNILAAENK